VPPADGDVVLPTWRIGAEVATRDAFGATLAALGRGRRRLVAVDGEVKDSTRSSEFEGEWPERFVEAYIAEQLMVGAAIGLDAAGWQPVLSTFGAFLTRAHDVLRMASIGRANLLVVGTHAGVSIGEDGPSQMGLDDFAMMRAIADSTVLSPSDANQAALLLAALVDASGVRYLRLMRGATPVIHPPDSVVSIGGSALLAAVDEPDVVLVATGVAVHEALAASRRLAEDGLAVPVLDAYSVKPIDDDAIARTCECGRIVVVEDHRPEGGLGEAVMASIARTGSTADVRHLAVRNVPGSAPPDVQRTRAGIDAESIAAAARRLLIAGRRAVRT
jgi:transketolase